MKAGRDERGPSAHFLMKSRGIDPQSEHRKHASCPGAGRERERWGAGSLIDLIQAHLSLSLHGLLQRPRARDLLCFVRFCWLCLPCSVDCASLRPPDLSHRAFRRLPLAAGRIPPFALRSIGRDTHSARPLGLLQLGSDSACTFASCGESSDRPRLLHPCASLLTRIQLAYTGAARRSGPSNMSFDGPAVRDIVSPRNPRFVPKGP